MVFFKWQLNHAQAITSWSVISSSSMNLLQLKHAQAITFTIHKQYIIQATPKPNVPQYRLFDFAYHRIRWIEHNYPYRILLLALTGYVLHVSPNRVHPTTGEVPWWRAAPPDPMDVHYPLLKYNRCFRTGPVDAFSFKHFNRKLHIERDFDAGANDFTIALHGVSITEMKKPTGDENGEVDSNTLLEAAIVHVPTVCRGGPLSKSPVLAAVQHRNIRPSVQAVA